MWFLKPGQELSPEDENGKIVAELWKELGGENTQTAESNQLIIFLGAIVMIQLNVEGTKEPSVEEIQSIHKKYQLLFHNRKSNKPQKKTKEVINEEKPKYTPCLCEESIRLAENGRGKYGKPEESKIDSSESKGVTKIVDALVQHKRFQEEYYFYLTIFYRKNARIKKEKEQEEQKVCTFHPQTIEYMTEEQPEKKEEVKTEKIKQKQPHVMVSTAKTTRDRCKVLYDLSKKATKHGDKPTDVYKYEKDSKEFTFHPNLGKDKVEGFKNKFVEEDVQETINKKKEEWIKKEKEKKEQERGGDDPKFRFGCNKAKFDGTFKQFSKKTSKPNKKSASIDVKKVNDIKKENQEPFSREISPQKGDAEENEYAIDMPTKVNNENEQKAMPKEALLFIDVNLANAQKRIIVCKGDTAKGLSAQFAEENSK